MYANATNTTILLIINLLILLYSLWINTKIFKSYNYIALPLLFSLLFFIFHILVHSYVIYSHNENFYYLNTIEYINPLKAEIFVTGCAFLYNIGVTFFYFNKIKLDFQKIPVKKFSDKKLLKVGITALCIGVVVKLIYFTILAHGNIFHYLTHYYQIQLENAQEGSGADRYLGFLFLLLDIGAYIIFINYLKTKKHKVILFLSFFAFLLYFNSRTSLILSIISYGILTALFNKKVRLKLPVYFTCIIIPLILFLAMGLGALRDSTNDISWEDKNKLYMTIAVSHNMRAVSDFFEYKSLFKQQYGKAILLPIIQKPIPRKFWKNKQYSPSMIYTDTMFPGAIENGNGIAAGLCFDLLLNFGVAGALITFFLLGYFFSFLSYSLLKRVLIPYNNTFYAILYATIGASFFYIRGNDIAISLYNYSMTLVPLLCIFLAVHIYYDSGKSKTLMFNRKEVNQ